MNEEQNINQLPKDWKWVKLGDVCEKMSNGTNAKQSDDKIGFPISRIETIWNETIDLGRVKYIQENETAFIEKYSLKKDDILFSHINSDIHLGKTAIYKNQTKILIHGINLLLIRLNGDALADFFNYQFKYKRRSGEFISIAQKSVNQSSINQPKLKNIDFVLPPKPTQQAIVSKIEELFSELDKGIENLRTAQQQLKIYRQSVLKWAFEGRLTNENVKEGELPKRWTVSNLRELKQFSLYGPRFSSKDYTENGIAVLRTTDISERGEVDWENSPKLNLTNTEYEKYKLLKYDLLITRTGSIGRLSIFNDNKKAIPGAFLIHYRLTEDLNIWYIFHFLKSQKGQKHFSEHSFGVGRPNLNVPNIELLQIPIPSTEEQNKIVQEIESRLSVADKMEESITQSLQQSEALRQSILKKAFEGKLIDFKN